MKTLFLILALIGTFGNKRIDIGYMPNYETVITSDGHMWNYYKELTGSVVVTFYTNGTDDVTDDIIISVVPR